MRGRVAVRVATLVLAASVPALSAATAAAATKHCDEPTRGWQRAGLDEAGLDREALDFALHSYQDRRAFAVRIYRHGCLVATDTNGPPADVAQYELWGVTRSVLSLLAGRAMQLGLLAPEDPLGALVPEADAEHGALRVEHLLTLTSGLRSSAVRDEDLAVPDRLHDALVTWVAHPPGRRFHEAPGAMALLVEALERATGQDVQTFAQSALFAHLGIHPGSWRWVRDDAGQTQGSFGLNMTVADVARLAELLRRGGVWEGRRLLAERYVAAALQGNDANPCHGWLVFTNARKGCTRTEDGYRVTSNDRLLPGLPADVWQFRGRQDQLVTAFGETGLMVVRTGTRGGDSRNGEDGLKWEVDVGRQLLGAVRDQRVAWTEPHHPLRLERRRPYDQPERLSDSLAPYFPPPLAPAGPARSRAAVVEQRTRRVGRRRLLRVAVRCPAPSAAPCTGELQVETAKRPAPFSLAPGTTGTLVLRLARRPRARTALRAQAVVRDAAGTTSITTPLVLDP